MSTSSKKNSDGCLWIVITVVLTIVSFGVIKIIGDLPDLMALILAGIFSLFLTFKILGKPSIKALIINGFIIFSVFYGIKVIGGFLLEAIRMEEYETEKFVADEKVTNDIIIEGTDTIPVFTSNRVWRDNYGNNYNGPLTVREKDFKKLYKHLENYRPGASGNYWGDLYNHIDNKDTPHLDLVLNTFRNIHAEKKLNQMEFAEMVVSCIQDIPYSFVFQDECLPAAQYEESIKRVLEKCPECCIGNVIYGVQNPVSFIQNLKGDCDTRTVLIYSILKHFNYDVAILNSDYYRHSILGLNIAGTGLNKVYKGKKYYLWETTAKYYKAGNLPTNFNDVIHWNVVLTSK